MVRAYQILPRCAMTSTLSTGTYRALKLAFCCLPRLSFAICGIVYELIIGSVSSYLLGNSVLSILGDHRLIHVRDGDRFPIFRNSSIEISSKVFAYIEIALAVVGGLSSIALFLVFPFTPYLYQLTMFGLIFVIGILVGLEIPILTRVLAADSGTRISIANVMSLDYIGALVGSVAFPLFLLPSLGLVRASFAIGLINACVALLAVVFLRDYLRNYNRVLSLAIGSLVILIALTAFSSRLTAFAEQSTLLRPDHHA